MRSAYEDHVHFEGGDFAGPVIGKVEYGGRAPAPTALDSLPAPAAGFTGRDDELGRLLAALDGAAEEAVLVTAVSGLGGIGKTALAVTAAHQARERGWFPGGVLFVDLHGYDEAPVTAEQALQSLLRALGVEPEHVPATADERAVLYRSVLAERAGDRGPMLILADNASSPEQVRPLLPGDARHRVLVTSRNRLPQLPARLLPLNQLTATGSKELLDRALRIADLDDRRITDEPEAARRLAALCGHWPLALRISAALLAAERDKPVMELVGELEASRDLLADLEDGERSVRAAFALSYRRLPAGQARLLRLLALAPGPEVSEEAAAALVGTETAPLRDLRGLVQAHLVERGSTRGRWRLHDLVRMFGAGVAAEDEGLREEAVAARERVLEFYALWAGAADDRLRWLPGMPEPELFAGRGQALAWLDGERAGLVAAVSWAEQDMFAETAVRLALSLTEYLDWRRYFDDKIAVCRAAQGAAYRGRDRYGEAAAWTSLGIALKETGRAAEAIEAHTRARDLFRTAGDHHREAASWNNLGIALREAGRKEAGIDAHTRARDLSHVAGDRHREAMAWNNLGIALQEAGRVAEAIEAHTGARDLFQTSGDHHGEATVWNNLGLALREAGRVAEAIEAFDRSLAVCREFEDWYGTGRVLYNLAITHLTAHRLAEARAHWLQAADAYTRANAPTEAAMSRDMAEALTAAPEPPEPTDKPTPASPPARKPASARPSPPPPGAPDTAGP